MQEINSISRFHELLSLPDPLHPLVSVLHVADIRPVKDVIWDDFFLNFYTISLKRDVRAKGKYGNRYHDFDKGLMTFTAPRQLQSHIMVDESPESNFGTGYVLLVHPEFLETSSLREKIKLHGYFDYAVNEALHLSAREEQDMLELFRKIETECQHLDPITESILLSQIELMLNYSERFYQRQFITRKQINNSVLRKLNDLLNDYFSNKKAGPEGLPVVTELAAQLAVSQRYLSDMLRATTGLNTQQFIHEMIIQKAKERLSNTNLTINEIAYGLGFEQPQSFHKLFKNKTNQSPKAFRSSSAN